MQEFFASRTESINNQSQVERNHNLTNLLKILFIQRHFVKITYFLLFITDS